MGEKKTLLSGLKNVREIPFQGAGVDVFWLEVLMGEVVWLKCLFSAVWGCLWILEKAYDYFALTFVVRDTAGVLGIWVTTLCDPVSV